MTTANKEYQRAWRAAHIDSVNDSARKHRSKFGKEYQRAWRARNPDSGKRSRAKYESKPENKEKKKAYRKIWLERNPDYKREHNLRSKFGITIEDWNKLFNSQGKCCAVCKSVHPKNKRDLWHVDHQRDPFKVRGILCHHCNLALGHCNDDPLVLRGLADYVERSR